ncbi:MAG TPA: cupin domain-containing protein [Cyclobacteriaceae bacterium]|nr:cupin domain-containing protein [Cyclobacteriaceae bacterium]
MKKTIVNPVIKDKATFLQTAKESGKKLTEIEITLLPGGGNRMHYHKTYSETFTAVNGEVGLKFARNQVKILKPGESFTIKPMELHCFFNPGKAEIKFNIRIEPGHEGFENSLRIIYGLAADGLTDNESIPKKLSHAALVINMSDMNAPGLLTWIFPLLKWIATRAKARGEERRLIEQYCLN